MFFGRPFWGPLLNAMAATTDVQFHRVIGGAHVFLVPLGGIGLAAAWRLAVGRWHAAAAFILTGVLLYPMVRERAQFLANNQTGGLRNLAAHDAARASIDAAMASAARGGGRVYAGIAGGWGAQFKVGDVPLYGFHRL
jgi:hypothetical protein